MDEDSAQLRDRARRYRQLANMVTDDKLMDVLLALANELDERGKEAESHHHTLRGEPSSRRG